MQSDDVRCLKQFDSENASRHVPDRAGSEGPQRLDTGGEYGQHALKLFKFFNLAMDVDDVLLHHRKAQDFLAENAQEGTVIDASTRTC